MFGVLPPARPRVTFLEPVGSPVDSLHVIVYFALECTTESRLGAVNSTVKSLSAAVAEAARARRVVAGTMGNCMMSLPKPLNSCVPIR